jgi:hypothetical protein
MMISFALRFSVYVCIVAVLCLVVTMPVFAQGVNLFDKKNRDTDNIKKNYDNEGLRRITEALKKTVDPEEKNTLQTIRFYGIFLAGRAALVAGILYWNAWIQKQMEKEMNDPMYLVRALNFAHQLSEPEKRLMQEISTQNSLPSPLKLFVEPKFFLDTLENDLSTTSRLAVRQLLSKLFDITIEESEASIILAGMKTEIMPYSPTRV